MTFWKIVAFILQVAIGSLPIFIAMNADKFTAWCSRNTRRLWKWMWEEEA